MYQLFCDSNCELWHTTVKELGLNVIRMPYIMGEEEIFYDMGEKHDFKGFCASGSSIKTTVRTIYALDIDFNGEAAGVLEEELDKEVKPGLAGPGTVIGAVVQDW